jgi:hypothetical protein
MRADVGGTGKWVYTSGNLWEWEDLNHGRASERIGF